MRPTVSVSRGRLRRLFGLMRKESLQILRDPSSFVIAGALPMVLLFIFGFGVSLDLRSIPVAVVVEWSSPEADSFVASFRNSRFFNVHFARHRAAVEHDLVNGRLKGIIVLAADFSERLGRGDTAPIQVLVDGSDPNTAGLVQIYVQGVWANWLQQEALAHDGLVDRPGAVPLVSAETRVWFNPELNSQHALLPGAVAIVLTLIGTLLTSLVVAREWERGTMEALLANPVTPGELLIGKIVPYFLLGMGAMALSTAITVFVFNVPFRGSVLALTAISSAYLAVQLGLGLLISTVTKNQFAASQAAVISGFMPAFELSGFIFEIDSMPAPIRLATYFLPPRYYVSCLQTIFLAGDVPAVLVPNGLVLAGMAAGLFLLLRRVTRVRWSKVMWWRIRCLIIKELLAVWSDPKSRFLLLGPPVIEMFIFAYAATQEVKNVPVAVLNRDLGTYGRDLVARIEGSPNFSEVRHLHAEQEIAPAIDNRSVLLVVYIREDFSRQIAQGLPASVQLILDGRSSNASQILGGYAQQIIARYNTELAQYRPLPPPSDVLNRAWFNPNLEALWSTVPSLVAILVALEGLMVTGLSVARERELGTFEQLLVSPLSTGEIVIGKTVPAFLIGLAEGTLMVVFAMLMFRLPLTGSAVLLYASMSLFLLAIIGIGLFISSLAKTQQQAILGVFSAMVPLILLSGFASPIENMPDWLQVATMANPVRHFMVIVKGLFLKAMPAADVLQSLWPLLAIAAVTLACSTRLFRRRAG